MKQRIRSVRNWCLLLTAVMGVCSSLSYAQRKDIGDLYFGTVKSVGASTVEMDLINLNIRKKAKGSKTFHLGPEVTVAIEQADRKFRQGASISEVAGQRWIWVASFDGETTNSRVTATNFQSFRGIVNDLKPDTVIVQLSKIRIGNRYWGQSAKKPPKTFNIPASVPCYFQRQPVSLSEIDKGSEVDILTERGVIVSVTIIN